MLPFTFHLLHSQPLSFRIRSYFIPPRMFIINLMSLAILSPVKCSSLSPCRYEIPICTIIALTLAVWRYIYFTCCSIKRTINKKGMKDARLFRCFTAYVERWKRIFEIHDIFRKSSIVYLKYDSWNSLYIKLQFFCQILYSELGKHNLFSYIIITKKRINTFMYITKQLYAHHWITFLRT